MRLGTRHTEVIVCLCLTAVVLVTFWPISSHDFLGFDDDYYITENPPVQEGLTGKAIKWAFTTMYEEFWFPLTWLSHMLDCQLFGLNAGMHHMTSLLFHTANSVLLFLVLGRMTGTLWRSAFVAALFALHPLHVEPVAWVSSRKDVLFTLFWILTMGAYLRYVREPGIGRYMVVVICFVLGFMAKPMIATLPFVLFLMDCWPLGRLQLGSCRIETYPGLARESVPRLLWEKAPLFALAAILMVVAVVAQGRRGGIPSLEFLPLEARFSVALVSYVGYLGKTLWPENLAVCYPHPGALPVWQATRAGLLLVCLSVLVFVGARKRPYLAVGWLWYLGTLVPVIGLVHMSISAMPDRYTYIPLIGLFIILAWGVPDLFARWRFGKTVLPLGAGVLVLSLLVCTRWQVRHWKDTASLFRHALDVTQDNYVAHYNLGVSLANQGKSEDALHHFYAALRIRPTYALGHYTLGNHLGRQGKLTEAAAHFRRALQARPTYAEAHYSLGIVMGRQGQVTEAMKHYFEALRFKADYAEAHNNLGDLLVNQSRLEEAIRHFRKVLQIQPQHALAKNNLGIALLTLGNHLGRQGKFTEAAAHFRRALQARPTYAEAHYSLGIVMGRQGQVTEAMKHYFEALRFKADYAEAHNNLGDLLVNQSRLEEAIRHFRKALQIQPQHALARNNLGIALLRQGHHEEALLHFSKAVQINPADAKAHNNLGATLTRLGRFQEAIPHFSEALRIAPDHPGARQNLAHALEQKREQTSG